MITNNILVINRNEYTPRDLLIQEQIYTVLKNVLATTKWPTRDKLRMKDTVADFTIVSVTESPIVDVFLSE